MQRKKGKSGPRPMLTVWRPGSAVPISSSQCNLKDSAFLAEFDFLHFLCVLLFIKAKERSGRS
jgi:hypothetical protein